MVKGVMDLKLDGTSPKWLTPPWDEQIYLCLVELLSCMAGVNPCYIFCSLSLSRLIGPCFPSSLGEHSGDLRLKSILR